MEEILIRDREWTERSIIDVKINEIKVKGWKN